jgi:hypothetical protein
LQGRCSFCSKERSKAYYEKNSAERISYQKKRYEECREEKIKYAKDYYEKNREAILSAAKSYQEENKKTIADYQKQYREKNKDRLSLMRSAWVSRNAAKIKETYRSWYSLNQDKVRASGMAYREKNKDAIKEKKAAYFQANKEVINKKSRAAARVRYWNSPTECLKARIRGRLGCFVRDSGLRKHTNTQKMLGCDWDTFKDHIESKFLDGMTWGNRGKWHIDHVIPLASAKTEDELFKLSHYSNLQPLWAKDNQVKGARF